MISKRQVKEIIKEEVDVAISLILSADRPFKYTRQGQRDYRCAESNCGKFFQKTVWFQIYCSRECGSRRRARIAYKWKVKHGSNRKTLGHKKGSKSRLHD